MLEEHDRNLEFLLEVASSCDMTVNDSKSQLRVRTTDMLGYRVSFLQVKSDPERLQPMLDIPPPRTPRELKRVSGMFDIAPSGSPSFQKRPVHFCTPLNFLWTAKR